MSAAEHTGKLVLRIPQRAPDRRGRAADPGPGLPQATAPTSSPAGWAASGCSWPRRWPRQDAARIVLTSRSQPNPQAQKTIDRLRSNGADIVGRVRQHRRPGHRSRLVAAATATGLPLRGVLHAAAVVDDATLGNITDELIDRDWAPKVYGAWHLHQATAGQPLDWFCSFSSAAALLGSPGQGAYAAANSWLDAFTAWRRSQGLPGHRDRLGRMGSDRPRRGPGATR